MNSNLTFKDFTTEFESFIQLTWNGKLVYDDYQSKDDETAAHLREVCEKYGPKKVYQITGKVVQIHHMTVDIIGEE